MILRKRWERWWRTGIKIGKLERKSKTKKDKKGRTEININKDNLPNIKFFPITKQKIFNQIYDFIRDSNLFSKSYNHFFFYSVLDWDVKIYIFFSEIETSVKKKQHIYEDYLHLR